MLGQGAALAAAAPIVSKAAKEGAKHRLIKQIVGAALNAVDEASLRELAAQGFTQVATAEAHSQVKPRQASV